MSGQGGIPNGPLAEDYYMSPGFPHVVTTEWRAGSVVEASQLLSVNHGGGYSYRLCQVPKEGMKGLTEECFQEGHLEFFGDKQWIQYDVEDGKTNVIEVEALRTKEGTFPERSQWTRIPTSNCRFPEVTGPDGKLTLERGFLQSELPCVHGTQFPSLSPRLEKYRFNKAITIVDKLVLPRDLTPADYVLSFRLVGKDEINLI